MVRKQIRLGMFGMAAILVVASGCRHKYDNPITKDTQQPDKVLFDTAIDDIEHGRYERARLTLQTMMNTYDTSEYLAKAKLAVADSWKREGGAHGLAQAEADYKDFILFFPNMEEAAEAQFKICDMQYQQMDKADRDPVHARLADAECKEVVLHYPNSKFAIKAAQYQREVQENLAQSEMNVGIYYYKKGGNGFFASANRLTNLVRTYPLYSNADEALWLAADDYNQLGDRYEKQQGDMYTQIVRDYPLSPHANDAKAQLHALGLPVPDPDPVAEARMKFELANRPKRGILSKAVGPFSSRPYLGNTARSGNPQMETFKPSIPLDVPEKALGETTNTVTIGPAGTNRDILDNAPDARAAGAADTTANPAGAGTTGATPDKPGTPEAAAAAGGAAANPEAPATVSKGKAKTVKPPKPETPKRRPKPSEQNRKKGTMPPPAPPSGNATPAAAAAKANGGGGLPQLP